MGGPPDYGDYGFQAVLDANWTADQIWNLYMGGKAPNRPFGTAVLDGVTFDLEKGNGSYMTSFIERLNGNFVRSRREYWFTASPQCPFPDVFMQSFLNVEGSLFKYIHVQFYNQKICSDMNLLLSYMTYWAPFVRGFSPKPQLIIGLPAAQDAAPNGGYLDPIMASLIILMARVYGDLAGFGFWSVNLDVLNRFEGKTWSQTVVANGV
eukprot:jgi/Botrbrau1/8483/Bobra.0237s0098.2